MSSTNTSEATLIVRRMNVVSGRRLSRYGRAARTSDSSTGGTRGIGSIVTTSILRVREGDLALDDGSVRPDHDARKRAGIPAPGHRAPAERDPARPTGSGHEDLDVRRLAAHRERRAV